MSKRALVLQKGVPHKIALYIRAASAEEAGSTQAIKEQEKRLRNLIRSRNRQSYFGQVVGCYTDLGESGMDSQRPGLQALLEAIQKGEVTVVLTTDVARLSRSMKDLLKILTTFEVNGCRLETSTTGHIPLGTVCDLYRKGGRR